MTIRQTIAMLYGLTAAAVALAAPLPSQAEADRAPRAIEDAIRAADQGLYDALDTRRIALEEIEPGLTGHPEHDDLPSYLSDSPADALDIAWADTAHVHAHSVLAADGPAGLSWTQMIVLGLLALVSLTLAIRSPRNA